jgi:hypothetical protein
MFLIRIEICKWIRRLLLLSSKRWMVLLQIRVVVRRGLTWSSLTHKSTTWWLLHVIWLIRHARWWMCLRNLLLRNSANLRL